MIADHTFHTFFFIFISSNFFMRYLLNRRVVFTVDILHHVNKLEDKKDLLF